MRAADPRRGSLETAGADGRAVRRDRVELCDGLRRNIPRGGLKLSGGAGPSYPARTGPDIRRGPVGGTDEYPSRLRIPSRGIKSSARRDRGMRGRDETTPRDHGTRPRDETARRNRVAKPLDETVSRGREPRPRDETDTRRNPIQRLMFTGIIEELGRIESAAPLDGGVRLTVSSSFAGEMRADQSVSINGACQTVVRADNATFDVVAVEETLAKTTLGSLEKGDAVNLERAMRPAERLDGHVVQGHVDGTGTIDAAEELADSRLYGIAYDPEFARYLIPVGSIAVDGVSLTVARLNSGVFTVSIIPHTFELTNVASWEVGTKVNLEFDLIGKYVARWMETRST